MFLLYLARYCKCNFVKEPFISTSCLRPTPQLQLLVKQALILWYHKFANIYLHFFFGVQLIDTNISVNALYFFAI